MRDSSLLIGCDGTRPTQLPDCLIAGLLVIEESTRCERLGVDQRVVSSSGFGRPPLTRSSFELLARTGERVLKPSTTDAMKERIVCFDKQSVHLHLHLHLHRALRAWVRLEVWVVSQMPDCMLRGVVGCAVFGIRHAQLDVVERC